MSVSVVLIAKNGEAPIQRCLESVAWMDEIVVGSGNADRIVEICRELGAAVHQTPD